ncbi:MAG: hypothetical protein QM765_33745 [Myxococcales bacterium]
MTPALLALALAAAPGPAPVQAQDAATFLLKTFDKAQVVAAQNKGDGIVVVAKSPGAKNRNALVVVQRSGEKLELAVLEYAWDLSDALRPVTPSYGDTRGQTKLEDANGDGKIDLIVELPAGADASRNARYALFLARDLAKKRSEVEERLAEGSFRPSLCEADPGRAECKLPVILQDYASMPAMASAVSLDAALAAAKAVPTKGADSAKACQEIAAAVSAKAGLAALMAKKAVLVRNFPMEVPPYRASVVPFAVPSKKDDEEAAKNVQVFASTMKAKKKEACPVQLCAPGVDGMCFECLTDRPACLLTNGTFNAWQWLTWEGDKLKLSAFSAYDSAG